jgi:hypothetical protein
MDCIRYYLPAKELKRALGSSGLQLLAAVGPTRTRVIAPEAPGRYPTHELFILKGA